MDWVDGDDEYNKQQNTMNKRWAKAIGCIYIWCIVLCIWNVYASMWLFI